ncbi:MAG: hypothetical protein SPF04_01835 [Bacilli bacterium]|nr:hypothetical protein [Candidatus Onthovivens sp.]MDY5058203.1 hypothetical protein [Bacilli bacterium]
MKNSVKKRSLKISNTAKEMKRIEELSNKNIYGGSRYMNRSKRRRLEKLKKKGLIE